MCISSVLDDRNHNNFLINVFELECAPLYGSYAVCGKRPAMEVATANIPNVAQFMKLPAQMSAAYQIIKACEPEFIWSI